MTTFKRKENVRTKLNSEDLSVHTGVRFKNQKPIESKVTVGDIIGLKLIEIWEGIFGGNKGNK